MNIKVGALMATWIIIIQLTLLINDKENWRNDGQTDTRIDIGLQVNK